MAIYNNVTGERKLEGKIISERGTFRMDQAQDEIVYWDDQLNAPNMMWLSQGDWFVERGSDLDEETSKKYYEYCQAENKSRQDYFKTIEELTFKKDSVALVYKGRTIKIGLSGKVVAVNENRFGQSILINVEGKNIWISASNCKIDVQGFWMSPR